MKRIVESRQVMIWILNRRTREPTHIDYEINVYNNHHQHHESNSNNSTQSMNMTNKDVLCKANSNETLLIKMVHNQIPILTNFKQGLVVSINSIRMCVWSLSRQELAIYSSYPNFIPCLLNASTDTISTSTQTNNGQFIAATYECLNTV